MKVPAYRTTSAMDIHIGKRLLERRIELGIDRQKLATSLGVDVATVETFEEGRRRIDAGQLLAITRELNVPLAHFFEDMTAGDGVDPVRLLEILRKLR